MRLVFLGTNGWYSTATGNTVCAVLVSKKRLISLDAGDGFHKIPELVKETGAGKIDVFLSHLHMDHVVGLHCLPRFQKGVTVRVFAEKAYVEPLGKLLDHPFTASRGQLKAEVELLPLREGENSLPYRVLALPLEHSDPCTGFRFELDGKSVAYCTDTGPCDNILKLGEKADVLITECSLRPGERSNPSWPHLSPEGAAEIAKKAGVGKLVLQHFDANRYGSMEDRENAGESARKIFRNSVAAVDGLEIEL